MEAKSRPISVAYVFLDFGEGGAQRLALSWWRLLDPRRVMPTLICLGGSGALVDEAVRAGVPVRVLGRLGRAWDVGAVRRLAQVLERGTFDAVHVASYSRAAPYALAAARLAGIRLRVVHDHCRPGPRSPARRTADAALQTGARFITVSSAMAVDLVADGVKPEHVSHVPNGVEDAFFEPQDRHGARLALALSPGRPVVVVPARLAPRKGHLDLLAAWGAVQQHAPGAIALFAGDGPLRGPLQALVESAGLGGSVRLLGHCADIKPVLAAADVAVLPSRLEGVPLALLEAMAAGLPVVASDVGGVADAVEDGVTGLLVPPRDPAALGDAVGRMLSERIWAKGLGQAGQTAARRHFRATDSVRALEQTYARWWRELGSGAAGQDPGAAAHSEAAA